jgi:hypothetical protein
MDNAPGTSSGRESGARDGHRGSGGGWVRAHRGLEGRHIGTLYCKVAEAIHLPACERLTDSSRPYVRLCLTGTASCGKFLILPQHPCFKTSVCVSSMRSHTQKVRG